jgi:hypothetical protein
MAVVGIITCEIFELEFARLLGEDRQISRISILRDSHSAHLIELLEARQLPHLQCLPHPHSFHPEPGEPLEVLIQVLALGLHRNRHVLSHALAKAAHALEPKLDALLLGYGQCGGALKDIRTVVDVALPLFQPMDEDCAVDDCVALCLGGHQRYYTEQRHTAGTFFLTPGWSRHWRRMLDKQSTEVSQPGLKRLLSDYERVLLIQTPALPDTQLCQRGDEFARLIGLRKETQVGTMAPLIAAWESAKAALQSQFV